MAWQNCKTVRIFARAAKQKVWSEAENEERDTGVVRLARLARVRLLSYATPILRKKPTELQSSVTVKTGNIKE